MPLGICHVSHKQANGSCEASIEDWIGNTLQSIVYVRLEMHLLVGLHVFMEFMLHPLAQFLMEGIFTHPWQPARLIGGDGVRGIGVWVKLTSLSSMRLLKVLDTLS